MTMHRMGFDWQLPAADMVQNMQGGCMDSSCNMLLIHPLPCAAVAHVNRYAAVTAIGKGLPPFMSICWQAFVVPLCVKGTCPCASLGLHAFCTIPGSLTSTCLAELHSSSDLSSSYLSDRLLGVALWS
jgi:hypothetical protein